MNPAVACGINVFGSKLIFKKDNALNGLWAYVLGPLIGGAIAGLFWVNFHGEKMNKHSSNHSLTNNDSLGNLANLKNNMRTSLNNNKPTTTTTTTTVTTNTLHTRTVLVPTTTHV